EGGREAPGRAGGRGGLLPQRQLRHRTPADAPGAARPRDGRRPSHLRTHFRRARPARRRGRGPRRPGGPGAAGQQSRRRPMMNHRNLSLSLAQALLAAESKPEESKAGPPPRPVYTIAVSRETGAQGNTVAAEVGRLLGWPVYDRNILDKVAEEV